jgi:FdhD protein
LADGRFVDRRDVVTVEEPLEIRVEFTRNGARETSAVSVTMRTPGNDFELAAGFLYGEGLVRRREDVTEISYCQSDEPQNYNIVVVKLRPEVVFDPDTLSRNFYMSSSCGVCGKASLEAVEVRGCERIPDEGLSLNPGILSGLPEKLRAQQGLFERTGGIHAAGRFDEFGELISVQEDVGRHNAVDKIVGEAFLAGELPLGRTVLAVSGRTSFEIIQKAVAAGIPLVVAVGAPSSLAVDLARRFNISLLGFTRSEGFNVYTGGERVAKGDGPLTYPYSNRSQPESLESR